MAADLCPGHPTGGAKAAKILAAHFGSMEALRRAAAEG